MHVKQLSHNLLELELGKLFLLLIKRRWFIWVTCTFWQNIQGSPLLRRTQIFLQNQNVRREVIDKIEFIELKRSKDRGYVFSITATQYRGKIIFSLTSQIITGVFPGTSGAFTTRISVCNLFSPKDIQENAPETDRNALDTIWYVLLDTLVKRMFY